MKEIDADYGTYVIEYTGLKRIYNSTTSDCSKTPTTKVSISRLTSEESTDGGNKFKGFFKIGPRDIRIGNVSKSGSSKDAQSQTFVVITYISDDKR